jgi:hypothetical protein
LFVGSDLGKDQAGCGAEKQESSNGQH